MAGAVFGVKEQAIAELGAYHRCDERAIVATALITRGNAGR
jgi:hypothetical protein